MPNIVVLVSASQTPMRELLLVVTELICQPLKWVISPYDEFAIETALKHKEATGGTVTALTLGPSDADKVLKDAKAIGVDEIVRFGTTLGLN